MPGIEDLMNIRTQGGTENAPMPPPGMPPQGGAPMGPPPQAGPPPTMPPMGGPPMGGPPAMPPDMGGAEQAPPSIEEDAASLAEAVVDRAGGDPQAAVAILDTAADLIMQSTQEEPMMAAGGGYMQTPQGMYMGGDPSTTQQAVDPRRSFRPSINIPTNTLQPLQQPPPLLQGGSPQARPSQGMMPQGSSPLLGMNMGGGIYPQYANEGRYLEDEADELRQMIMEGSRAGAAAAEAEGRDPRFRDYQPEGVLKGTLFDYVPDPIQLSSFLMDRFGQKGRTMSDQIRQALIAAGSQDGRTLTDEDLDFAKEMLGQSGRTTPLTQKEAYQPRDRLQEFFDAYEKDPDAFSKDAIEADAVEEERRKAAQRAAAYRSR